MKNTLTLLIFVLFGVFNCLAEDTEQDIAEIIARFNTKCPNIPLMQNATKKQRDSSILSTQEPLFMSAEYCFLLTGETLPKRIEDFPAIYHAGYNRLIYELYNRPLRALYDDTQRLYFTHFYLKGLSRKTTIAPRIYLASEPWITIGLKGTKKFNKTVWVYDLQLLRELSEPRAFELLNQVALNPPREEDHIKLVKLADAALDFTRLITEDEIEAIIRGY